MKISIFSDFEITRYSITSRKVTKDMRLAVIADLHNCMCEDNGRRLFNVICSEAPDLVVIAGDLLVSSSHADCRGAMEFLKLLGQASGSAPLASSSAPQASGNALQASNIHTPTFSVIYGVGNHERKVLERDYLIHQKRQLMKGIRGSGIKLFSNVRKAFIQHNICVLGLDLPIDYYNRWTRKELEDDTIEKLLGRPDKDRFNIMIAHDPLKFKNYVDYGADLVLSGHVHGGIVRLPFLGGVLSPECRFFPKYDAGRFDEKGVTMLVSKGLGDHTIPVRVNDPRELMIVDIKAGEINA